MELETKQIISFIFKRSGKLRLTKSEICLSLSIDLNWFSPDKANRFIDFVIKNNLLIQNNEYLKPSFDVYNVNIPFGFKPGGKYLSFNNRLIKDKINLDIIDIILEKNSFNKEDEIRIKNDILDIANKKNIISPISALLVFKKEKIDVNEYIELVENQIFRWYNNKFKALPPKCKKLEGIAKWSIPNNESVIIKIRLKAKDSYVTESGWAILPLLIAKNKTYYQSNPWLFRLIQRLLILIFLL